MRFCYRRQLPPDCWSLPALTFAVVCLLATIAGCSARTVVAPLRLLGQGPPTPTRVTSYYDRKICPRDVFYYRALIYF